jgi:excisionase family DNA binding protein
MKLLTTKEVAEILGVTQTRVQQLILNGRLPAQRMGRDNFIREEDLKLVENRKPGRPRKSLTEEPLKKAKKKGKKGK